MAGLNKVMLIGHLGRDPEIRYSQQGVAVVNFSIATTEQWTDKNSGDRQEKTEWHRIVVFGKQAEICEKYLSKGKQIYIEGRLQTSTYEKNGQTHYATDIIASNFQFLGAKSDTGADSGGYQGQRNPQGNPNGPQGAGNFHSNTQPGMTPADHSGNPPIPDDDIPF